MGRPLHKKYFGNRNIGTTGTADNGIGGEGIYAINWSNSGSWLSATDGQIPLSGLALPAPSLPGGVQATWTVSFGASEVTTGAGSVDLVVGETYEYADIPGLIVTVLTSTDNGTNATFAVTAPGSTTALLQDLTGVNITLRAGQGHTGVAQFLVDIKMKIVGVSINEQGSGYTGAETFTVTLVNGASGTAPVGTIVLTEDSGAVGTATNQENAIVINANTTNNGSKVGDIIKQQAARRYKVKTADGTAVCKLVATDSLSRYQAFIKATDDDGNTYFVTKLTSHRALLTQWNEENTFLFASGTTAPWSFTSTANGRVIIENA